MAVYNLTIILTKNNDYLAFGFLSLQKNCNMSGLLNEKKEVEKLQNEYKKLAEINFETLEVPVLQEELVLEDCES
ncbi:MAG: hypothetical protein PSV16_08275 [Flavobacterium sp.]|nr:hypothetical protein [Flavobacterium sp.]